MHADTCGHVCVHAFVFAYVHVHVCVHVCMCVCMCVHVCTYVCMPAALRSPSPHAPLPLSTLNTTNPLELCVAGARAVPRSPELSPIRALRESTPGAGGARTQREATVRGQWAWPEHEVGVAGGGRGQRLIDVPGGRVLTAAIQRSRVRIPAQTVAVPNVAAGGSVRFGRRAVRARPAAPPGLLRTGLRPAQVRPGPVRVGRVRRVPDPNWGFLVFFSPARAAVERGSAREPWRRGGFCVWRRRPRWFGGSGVVDGNGTKWGGNGTKWGGMGWDGMERGKMGRDRMGQEG